MSGRVVRSTVAPVAHDATADMAARIAALEAENARLKAGRVGGGISCKVSEKAACSVYGLQRWPITLYAAQWRRLLSADSVAKITAFLDANADTLAVKAE
jgi:uncharacterized small protein (DUF1192 family)